MTDHPAFGARRVQVVKDVGMDDQSVEDRLRDAVIHPDEATVESLLEAGPEGVVRFRDWQAGELSLSLPSGRDREFIDNTTAVSSRLASRFPDKYVETFAEVRWIRNSFILTGLGYTGRPDAEPILISALFSEAPGVTRLSAAVALRHFPTQSSVEALSRALDDSDYLVQYHAIESLGAVGDRSVLERLLQLAGNGPNRGIEHAARGAVRTLARRLGVPIAAMPPSRFPDLRRRIAPPDERPG